MILFTERDVTMASIFSQDIFFLSLLFLLQIKTILAPAYYHYFWWFGDETSNLNNVPEVEDIQQLMVWPMLCYYLGWKLLLTIYPI